MMLNIEKVENGWIVSEDRGTMMGRRWVFGSPEALGDFMREWANGDKS